ncbi:uncharacterized protein LOC121414060 [Lytechinus variegatus]|uniref:uncharacterized protein LOC121414060 n=1 Tax=Lytechinus variegatus TaxID=7654 RepID=UPI001BB24C81|nr:uncharacterized protein LOC121414060 [Lytechinus variegatus]
MTKSKLSKPKTNVGYGTPGSTDFRCKLPKNITISGINTALYHIQKNHLDQAVLKDDHIDYVVNELCSIYPNLNRNICRHYCISSVNNNENVRTDSCSDNYISDLNDEDQDTLILIQDGADMFEGQVENPLDTADLNINENSPSSIRTELQQVSRDNPKDNEVLNNGVPHQLENRVRDLESVVKDLRAQLLSVQEKIAQSTSNGKCRKMLNGTANRIVLSTKGYNFTTHMTTNEAEIDPATARTNDLHCHEQNQPSMDEQLRHYRARHQLMRASISNSSTSVQDAHSADILIVGDSMIKGIIPSRLSKRPVKCKTLRGARIGDVCDIVCEEAIQLNAKEVLLHFGSNDISSHDAAEIVAKLESLAEQITDLTPAKKICFSTIIHRRGESSSCYEKVSCVNAALKLLANQRSWAVVDNDNVTPDMHLAADGVHLNGTGVRVLAQNIIAYLRSLASRSAFRPYDASPTVASNQERTNNKLSQPMNQPQPFWQAKKAKFRKKPSRRVFPRDWLDCLQTARKLLNDRN